jgi:hypothetical protein
MHILVIPIILSISEFLGFLVAKYSLSELKFLKRLKYESNIFIVLNLAKSFYVINQNLIIGALLSIFNILEGIFITAILLIKNKEIKTVIIEILKLQLLFLFLAFVISILISI